MLCKIAAITGVCLCGSVSALTVTSNRAEVLVAFGETVNSGDGFGTITCQQESVIPDIFGTPWLTATGTTVSVAMPTYARA